MKAQVDRELCQGHARCHIRCPQVFDLDEQGFVRLVCSEVPEPLEESARRAAADCPEGAISLSE